MIIRHNSFSNFNNIKKNEEPNKVPDLVIYTNIWKKDYFDIITDKNRTDKEVANFIKKIIKHSNSFIENRYNNCYINSINKWFDGMIILLKDKIVKVKNKSNDEIVVYELKAGNVIIFRENFSNYWEFKTYEDNIIYFYNLIDKEELYKTINNRKKTYKKIDVELDKINSNNSKISFKKNILEGNILGKGDFGHVIEGKRKEYVFAIKYARIEKDSLKNPYDKSLSSWREWYILDNIIKPIILNGICPNLPLIYNSFISRNTKLYLRKNEEVHPTNILLMELADGTLKDFFKIKPDEEQLYCCLFQIMAGLHAIQHYGQIMNYDIKGSNILYYNINPGGFWEYTILGNKYYIPNYGKLFVISDFGISRSFSPKFSHYRDKTELTFRLGKRYAIVKDNIFLPIEVEKQYNNKGKSKSPNTVIWKNEVSAGAEYRLNRKNNNIYDVETELTNEQEQYLKSLNITTNPTKSDYFEHPDIIPPFEFYNDLQDVIRCFIGGKRTTQQGCHPQNIKKSNLYYELKKYLGKKDSSNDDEFECEPSQMLAGHFIDSFFENKYRTSKPKNILETYKIS
jgi:hypothetical protein